MSSHFASTGERAEVPQPVKKRGRFSVLEEDVNFNGEELQRARQPRPRQSVPEGFVRYELDEEDSEEDPDFKAEADAVDEEDEDDQFDELENVNEQQGLDGSRRTSAGLDHIVVSQARLQRPRRRCVSRDPNSQELFHHRDFHYGLSSASFEHRPGEDPHFEVDDLDSTDEDNEPEESESVRVEDGANESALPASSGDLADVLEQEDVEVDELDEADSDEEEEDEDVDDGEEAEEAPDEYQQFLMGLLNDTGGPQGASEHGAAGSVAGGLPPPSWAMDDDDDFDYLRESARVQDDPLEYRDDLQVSRKELVQLFSNSTAGNLRRQTRHSRVAHGSRPRQYATAIPHTPVFGANLAPPAAIPSSLMPVHTALAPTPYAPSAESGAVPTSVQPYIPPPHTSFMNLPTHALYQFWEQLSVHTQILTTIHAETRRASRIAREQRPDQATNPRDAQDARAAHEAANRSEILIRGLIENKKVSLMYHQAIGTNLSRLKGFSERLIHKDRNSLFKYENCKPSVYNMPVLDLLEGFLRDCGTASLADMPAGVLSRFEQFHSPAISQALRARPQRRQYSASGSRPGWFAWTAEDDRLLAMTMAKYGSEVGEFSKDLLPHRQEDDCETRVKYLSSRRCPDNPVKRQAMFISSPLNMDEVALVRRGLQMYGQGNTEDADMWKRIQAELLPSREWSHLQKLWDWRETRRKYKAKYRAKASQKKKALREGAAPS